MMKPGAVSAYERVGIWLGRQGGGGGGGSEMEGEGEGRG